MPPRRRETSLFLILLLTLSALTALAGTDVYTRLIFRAGSSFLNVPLIALFAILSLWIAIGFWTATFGFIREWFAPATPIVHSPLPVAASPLKTAVVMPIYNENTVDVFAGVAAMCEDLARAGKDAFDFFILSDTTDPDLWLEEESAWAALCNQANRKCNLYYRRRTHNLSRKSGNIRDFCEQWGSSYRYMIVLDADSLMEASTLIEMVRRMEDDPQLGIVQSPPLPIGRASLFARLQQFSAQFYGRIFTSGYALWSQVNGSYWGHNAIIRVQPFMECCGLPTLPGKAPLGGEILSHDFVEAALMRKAGWKVVVDHDLPGSYEACPTNLIDFAKRDQRWCQGNLQHIRLALSHGLNSISRMQLAMGAISYLSSLLWLAFLILAVLRGIATPSFDNSTPGGSPGRTALALFGVTFLLLLLPKLWALLLVLRDPLRSRSFGGPATAIFSVAVEVFSSIIIAPILMILHSTFVLAAFFGQSVRWETQTREDTGISLHDAAAAHAAHTIVGLLGALFVTWFAPGMLLWISPVLLPLVFSIPLSVSLGSRRIGIRLFQERLLAIPEEIHPPRIVRRQHHFRESRAAELRGMPHPFIRSVVDPKLNALHQLMLSEPENLEIAPEHLDRLRRVALSGGPAHLSKKDRMVLLRSAAAMDWLHHHAWNDWPVELLERCSSPRI